MESSDEKFSFHLNDAPVSTAQCKFNDDFKIYLKRYEQQESIVPDVPAVDLVSQGEDSNQTKKGKEARNQFTCYLCGSSYRFFSKLEIHMRLHTGGKPFVCNHCQKRFAAKRYLKQHLRIHSNDENVFGCSKCLKSYRHKSSFNRHLHSHSIDKPFDFACSKCSKRFSRKSRLNEHFKTHSGDRPFECSKCSKRFTLKKYLYEHFQTHRNDKPFKCSETECSKGFTLERYLKRHLQFHSKKREPNFTRKTEFMEYLRLTTTVNTCM